MKDSLWWRMRQRGVELGLTRSMVLRRLNRIGHQRMRELRGRGMAGATFGDRVLGKAFRKLEQGVLRVPDGHGAGLLLDMTHLPMSHAHFGSLASGNLESAVQEALVRHLGEGGVMYDIGANIGFFALVGARLAGQTGTVYAFEATPDNAETIRCNAALNRHDNIEVIAKAVSSHAGTGTLLVVDDQSWSKLQEYGEHPFTEQVMEVELVAIDDLVRAGEVKPPTVVKIDVEGAELAVLEGMRETIDAHQPVIICELHDTHPEFVEFMHARGYRLINLEGTVPVEDQGASAHAMGLPPLHQGD